ncbi:MAG TPA: hypothetical protein VEU96_23950 [Bryobacteraceae bacterium]|nr:hypothetical protein [Bryobacteraceae bacterium]
MERLDRQLRGEATWGGEPGNDRLEYGLMAGYVIIAIIAVMTAARTRIAADLGRVVPETPPAAPPHAFPASIFDLLSTSTDIIAAVGLLIIAGVMLYRRRSSNRPETAPKVASGRFDLPFLF